MTVENFKEYARKQGWYSIILYENISFSVKDGVKTTGFLSIIKKAFPDNYVCKEGRKYTIYAGDKEIQKFLHQPIKFETPQQTFRKEFKKDMNMLKNSIKD